MKWLQCTTLLLGLAPVVHCDFLIPPNVGIDNLWRDNPQYRVGEAINLTWATTEPTVDLILEMQLPNKPNTPGTSWKVIYLQRALPASNYRWIVDLGSFPEAQQILDENELAVLFLLVTIPNSGPNRYLTRSHYFNITNAAAPISSTTTTLAITTSRAGGSPTVSTDKPTVEVSPSPISVPTAAPVPTPTPAPSLPMAVIAGTVGGSVAGVAAISLVAFFLWRSHSKKKQRQMETYKEEPLPLYSQDLPDSHQKFGRMSSPAELSHQSYGPAELPHRSESPAELPAGSMYNAF